MSRIYLFMSMLLIALTACNNDIFIEDFTLPEVAFSLPGSGGSHTINLTSSKGVTMTVVMSAGDYAFYTVDADGNVSHDNWLDGDGTMHITHPRMDMEVTRRGTSVDIALNHFYSKNGESVEFYFSSEYKNHSDVLTIQPYNPFRLQAFEYDMHSIGIINDMGTSMTLFQGTIANHGSSEMKFPFVLDNNGIPVVYKFVTESAYDMQFDMIMGDTVPVPSSEQPDDFWEWGLLGDEAVLQTYGVTTLFHYPSMPEIAPIPGETASRIQVVADTEAMQFEATATVVNEHTSHTDSFIVWLLMDFPFRYNVVRNDTPID